MFKIRKVATGVVVIVTDKDDNVILMKSAENESGGLDYLSHLTSTLLEDYRTNSIIREGF